jgi:hypothetical protein
MLLAWAVIRLADRFEPVKPPAEVGAGDEPVASAPPAVEGS